MRNNTAPSVTPVSPATSTPKPNPKVTSIASATAAENDPDWLAKLTLNLDDKFVETSQETRIDWSLYILVAMAIGWLGLHIWQASDGFERVPASAEIPQLIAIAAAPLLLLVAIRILILLSSQFHTNRYVRVVTELKEENVALQTSIDGLVSRLNHTRQTLHEQGQIIQNFGDEAAHRIGASQQMIVEAREELRRVDTELDQAGDKALQHMQQLAKAVPQVSTAIEKQRTAALELQSERETLLQQLDRMSEVLKSAAIDLAAILIREVGDSDWLSYLHEVQRERGVMTHRAVQLLEHSTLDKIATLYRSNDNFRAQAEQYIADFETMIQWILNSEQGTAFSVTLLSSDVGKLYVALVQVTDSLELTADQQMSTLADEKTSS